MTGGGRRLGGAYVVAGDARAWSEWSDTAADRDASTVLVLNRNRHKNKRGACRVKIGIGTWDRVGP